MMEKVYQTETEERLKEWINMRTDQDGFTAMHFASFRGNIRVIKLLIKYGGDINALNNFGINVMHIAAQGDQPIAMYYFKQLGFSITSKDHRLSTPLHWACYSRSEVALCYLLAWLKEDEIDE